MIRAMSKEIILDIQLLKRELRVFAQLPELRG